MVVLINGPYYSPKSKKMKKVLIALDYEPSAELIAETGYKIATALNAEVTLLHVIAEPAYYSSMEYSPIMGFSGFMDGFDAGLSDVVKSDIKTLTQEFLEKSKQHLNNENIKTLIAEGSFAETIVESAGKEGAGMIVMGSHGRHGLDKLLMENIAQKVLHLSRVPVLVIPIKAP
jgi:nucleotide-binding universal stress UspA family protein